MQRGLLNYCARWPNHLPASSNLCGGRRVVVPAWVAESSNLSGGSLRKYRKVSKFSSNLLVVLEKTIIALQ